MPDPPGGKPILGVTNEDDVRWALDKARRFIFRGGDRTDPRYRAYVDRWLDYLNQRRTGMTWTIQINGHDDLTGDEKEALERVIVGEATGLFHSLKAQGGNEITKATVSTNTTGTVDLLA